MFLTGTIKDMKDIQHMNRVASEQPFEVYVSCDSTLVDCRSFVNLFPLIGKEVNIVVEDDVDNKAFKKMFKKMRI